MSINETTTMTAYRQNHGLDKNVLQPKRYNLVKQSTKKTNKQMISMASVTPHGGCARCHAMSLNL